MAQLMPEMDLARVHRKGIAKEIRATREFKSEAAMFRSVVRPHQDCVSLG